MLSEVEQQQQQQSQRNIVAAEGSGCVERPRLEITAEQLEYLFGYDLTFRDVAEALGVSDAPWYKLRVDSTISCIWKFCLNLS